MSGPEATRELQRLFSAASAGDPEAVGELFSRLHPYLVALLRRYGLKGPEAEDIAADTFVQVFTATRGTGVDPDIRDPAAYLAAVARHLAFREMRKRAHYQASLSLLDEALQLPADVDLQRDVEAADAVARALDVLGDLDRRLVEMSVAGYSAIQIAEQLDIPAGSVRTRLVRARKKLADAMRMAPRD